MIPVIPLETEQLFKYPFAWLDHLTEVILDPGFKEQERLSDEDTELLRRHLHEEFLQIWRLLKQQRFRMLFKKRQDILVLFYYEYLTKTREQLTRYATMYPDDHPKLDLGSEVLNGLEELLQQLRAWYGPLLTDPLPTGQKPETATPSFKVLCQLSVDQIAIVLKAADDIRLLTARSFSLVLRTLVPFLSTERLRDFSWKSARSSTYKMEGSDKEIVIRALEALIEKIREY